MRSAKTRIEILTTDGTSVRKIFWIEITKRAISGGLHFPIDTHWTYHDGGFFHSGTLGTRGSHNGWGKVPINRIRGVQQLCTFVISNTPKTLTMFPPLDAKKIDKAVYIDLRSFPQAATINVAATAIEPWQLGAFQESLESAKIGKDFIHSLYIITSTLPWVGISVFLPLREPSVIVQVH